MAVVELKNLNISEDIRSLEEFLANTKLQGVFEPMKILPKTTGSNLFINSMFQGANFDTIIMNNSAPNKIISCVQLFRESSGNYIEFRGFDFSEIGRYKTPGAMRGIFEFADIDRIHIDNLNPYRCRLLGLFKGLRCSVLQIDNFDLTRVTHMCHLFERSDILNLKLGNFNSQHIKGINSMFHGAHIHCDVDLSGIAKVSDFSNAFNFCTIDGELNLSGICFNTKYMETEVCVGDELIELFTGAKINALNLIGTDFGELRDYHASMFQSLQVGTLKVSMGNKNLLSLIKREAKSIGKIIEV